MLQQPVFAEEIIERRSKPRIACSYPAIVQGWDNGGRKFRASALLTNLSATGLYLVINSEVHPGKDMFVLFRCSSTGLFGNGKAPLIAVEGNVVRSSQPESDTHTYAVKIRRDRFL